MTRTASARRLALALALATLASTACGLHADVQKQLAAQEQAAGPGGPAGADELGQELGAEVGTSAEGAAPAGGSQASDLVTGPGAVTRSGEAGTGTGRPGGGAAADQGRRGARAASTLFTPAEDRIGISDSKITLCAHAALTYGKAFNTEAEDFNVFWTALNETQGGIFGRKVEVSYENDNYTPTDGVVAARACKEKRPFMLLGGIGFDATVGVRNYTENERLLYFHHSAPFSDKYRYSFTALPTTERVGEGFAQMLQMKYRGKKLGIIKRDGANFEIGVNSFKAYAKRTGGVTIVAERKVPQNKANYTDDILELKNKGAEVVWLWENSLTTTQIVKQMHAQNWAPPVMLVSANITAQTLGEDAMNPPIDGVEFFTAYSHRDYTGPFAAYADEMRLFEAQYAKYRPNVDLTGVGGDLLFLNWQGQKALYDILLTCGKDCTRNRFVDTLAGYRKQPNKGSCPLDFTKGDGHHGSDQLTFMQAYRAPSGKINFRNTIMCKGPR